MFACCASRPSTNPRIPPALPSLSLSRSPLSPARSLCCQVDWADVDSGVGAGGGTWSTQLLIPQPPPRALCFVWSAAWPTEERARANRVEVEAAAPAASTRMTTPARRRLMRDFKRYATCRRFLVAWAMLTKTGRTSRLHVSSVSAHACRLQNDPPAGVSGAPCENDIMKWNAVIFGYVVVLETCPASVRIRLRPRHSRTRDARQACGDTL